MRFILISQLLLLLLCAGFTACSSGDSPTDGDLDFEFEKWEEESVDGDLDAEPEIENFERMDLKPVEVFGTKDTEFPQLYTERWDSLTSNEDIPIETRKIVAWPDGGAYIAAKNGLFRYNTNKPEGEKLYKVENPKDSSTNMPMDKFEVLDMVLGESDTLYLIANTSTDDLLFKIISNSNDAVRAVECQLGHAPTAISAKGSGKWIYIGTTGPVYFFNGSVCDTGTTSGWPQGKLLDFQATDNDKVAMLIRDGVNETQVLWVLDGDWQGFSAEATESLLGGLIGGSLKSVLIDVGEENDKLDVWVGSSEGLQMVNRQESFTNYDNLPWSEVNQVIMDENRVVWAATNKGVIRHEPDKNRWKLYQGLRWLVSDDVSAIGFDSEGSLWAGHEKGISRLYTKSWKLKDKADYFEAKLDGRHFREVGSKAKFLARCELDLQGREDSNCTAKIESDEAIWTGMYALSQIFRAQSAKDPSEKSRALDRARSSLDSLMELINATVYDDLPEIAGLPARSIMERGSEMMGQPEWNRSNSYDWLGDTPDTSLLGHVLLYSFYYDTLASDAEKTKIRNTSYKIADHLIRNDFNLYDVDFEYTTNGRFDEEWTSGNKGQEGLGGLRSLELLALLRAVVNMHDGEVEDSPYWATYLEKADTDGLADLVKKQKTMSDSRLKNQSLDLNAFISYLVLLRIADVEIFRTKYLEALAADFQLERKERCPLFNFIFGTFNGHSYDLEEAIATLQEMPTDTVDRRINSCFRKDVTLDADASADLDAITEVLPLDERKLIRLNGNPFECQWADESNPDEFGGQEEDEALYFLLPYWLGRQYGMIGEP